jgi:rubrerythrin
MENFCMFFEEALKVAIKSEEDSFNTYFKAMKKVSDKGAKALLRELAKDELEHIHKLELALLDEEALETLGEGEVPEAFSLSEFMTTQDTISEDSSLQDIYSYAISSEKKAIKFYSALMNSCKGSKMEYLFNKLRDGLMQLI